MARNYQKETSERIRRWRQPGEAGWLTLNARQRRNNPPMTLFKRYYIVSATILCVVAMLSVLSSIGSRDFSLYAAIVVLVAAVPFIPILRQGGVNRNRKLSTCISGSLALGFAILLGSGFLEFVRTAGGEGAGGEGSPLSVIIALTFFAALFVCPWLLTVLRGLRIWNHPPQVEQGGAGNPAKPGPHL